jgi:ATP-dependent protease ClpP protease subunit
MPSWDELRKEFDAQPNEQTKLHWLDATLTAALQSISTLRNDRNVIVYGSAFLQKPQLPPITTMIMMEDINGLMSVMQGMDCTRNLTLVLHTPGGDPGAANALMAYLHSKFTDIETIVPTYAMSAGTMMCLGSNRIIMGRQSQLGPIDAQMVTSNGTRSAGAMIDAFERARAEILQNTNLAHLWHPVLQSMGPSLIQEAQNSLDYGEAMVKGWLEKRMFAGQSDAATKATSIARHFNAVQIHKNHSRRIDRDEARGVGVLIDELEPNQAFQDAVLTAYHALSLNFSVSKAVKILANNNGLVWQKVYG